MPLSLNEIKDRALAFSREWEGAKAERAEAQTFWNEFFAVFGISRRRIATFEEPVKTMPLFDNQPIKGGFIDLFWRGILIAEHKSLGHNLDSAYKQALDYFAGLPERDLPRYVIVSDFARIRLYDLDANTQTEFLLKDLYRQIKLFGFIAGYTTQRIAAQDPVNIKAAERMGKLHDRLREAGYKGHALKLIHEQISKLPVSEDTILRLHKLTRGDIWDSGRYKTKDGDIIEKYTDGRERVRFKTVPAAKTPSCMTELTALWNDSLNERWVHPLIILSAFNLDFLCIHPFRDGNGRVSRLLLLLQLYHLGYEVGRYISIERIIEQSKDRYYETLEQSSRDWHDGKHDPWPYINYVLFTLKTAYKEFEERVGQLRSPKGAKTELIKSAINSFAGEFSLSDLERECSGVSRDMIRRVLREVQGLKQVECLGRGPGAKWKKRGNTSKRG